MIEYGDLYEYTVDLLLKNEEILGECRNMDTYEDRYDDMEYYTTHAVKGTRIA